MTTHELQQEILRLKKEKNVCILAHAYQSQDVYKRQDEGQSAHCCPLPGCPAHPPLIRRCGATFPQRGEGKEIINRENHHVQPT